MTHIEPYGSDCLPLSLSPQDYLLDQHIVSESHPSHPVWYFENVMVVF